MVLQEDLLILGVLERVCSILQYISLIFEAGKFPRSKDLGTLRLCSLISGIPLALYFVSKMAQKKILGMLSIARILATPRLLIFESTKPRQSQICFFTMPLLTDKMQTATSSADFK